MGSQTADTDISNRVSNDIIVHKVVGLITRSTLSAIPSSQKFSIMAEEPYNSPTRAHILVFPFPAQGHMLPLLDFTHQLCLQGLTVTILVTPKNLPILQPILSRNPSIQTLVLPFPSHPSVPAGVENVKDLGNHGNALLMSALAQLSGPITDWFKSHPSPPVAILSDFFLGWTHDLACQIGVPRIAFYTSGAFLTSVMNHLWRNLDRSKPLDIVELPDLPNSPVFPWEHIPSVFRKNMEAEPFIKDGFVANTLSWGAVFNTFDDIEHVYMEHLRKEMGHKRVWAVGPVSLLNKSPATTERGGANSVSTVDVLSWLDGTGSDGSVVYVCFGSQVLLTHGQIEALAKGLEESGIRFILAVKSQTYIPDGFEDRVAGKGFVIKGWAPQVAILSHRAVGGFLTHCGWNSVLEGIVGGVMLLTWAMEADQFVNAKLLVEDMGAAVRACEGADTIPDSTELAKLLQESMSGTRGEKARAMDLHEKALGAVKEGGSSRKDLDGLVKELCALAAKSVQTF